MRRFYIQTPNPIPNTYKPCLHLLIALILLQFANFPYSELRKSKNAKKPILCDTSTFATILAILHSSLHFPLLPHGYSLQSAHLRKMVAIIKLSQTYHKAQGSQMCVLSLI